MNNVIIIVTLLSSLCFSQFCNASEAGISIQRDLPVRYREIPKTNITKLKAVWGDPEKESQVIENGNCSHCVTSIDYSSDGKTVLSAHITPGKGYYEGGVIKLWDATNGVIIHTLIGHSRAVNSVVFSPNGLRAASASTDGTVRLWDITTGLESKLLKKVHAEYDIAWSVAFTPYDDRILVAINEDPSLKLLDINSGEEIQTYETNWNIRKISITRDGKFALTISPNELPTIWNVMNGKLIKIFRRQGGVLSYLFSKTGTWSSGSLSHNGEKIVASSTDGMIRLWEVSSGKESWAKLAHKGGVNDVSFSANGKFILSAGNDATVKIWNSTDGELIDQIDLAISNDMGVVLSCSPDNNSFVVGTLRGIILHFQLIN